jgi:prepilin-type N-terminal cleavage/methylation domain-containing protein
MMYRLRARLASESGFSLLELLVVMVLIGVLAAIAYAVFIGQRTKANDAVAKDAAATLNVAVASCFAEAEDYTRCVTAANLRESSLAMDPAVTPAGDCSQNPAPGVYPDVAAGKVAVVAADPSCYILQATSKDGHFFWQVRRAGVPVDRRCAPAGQGGCAPDGSWNRT